MNSLNAAVQNLHLALNGLWPGRQSVLVHDGHCASSRWRGLVDHVLAVDAILCPARSWLCPAPETARVH